MPGSTPPLRRVLRRGRRRLSSFFAGSPPALFYSRRYTLDLPSVAHDARRGDRILAFLDSAGLLPAGSPHSPQPATFQEISRVHDYEYLESLNRPDALVKIVGQAIADDVVERLLAGQRHMVGGTLAAARRALEEDGVAINLGGGLHHAFADRGERFCAYNDVAVAIGALRTEAFAGKILVVDLDLHDGDGTRSLFAADESVHTFSIHNRTTPGIEAVESTVVELPGEVGDETYLAAIREHLPPVAERFGADLVFYLAGCDPAADDEIGNWKISAEGLLARDRFVLETTHGGRRSPPLVFLLAGGYGPNSWRYSARFLSALLHRDLPVEPPSTADQVLARYRDVARDLDPHELSGDPESEDWGLTEGDLALSLGMPHRPQRFLGFYSHQGLELALERSGLLDRLRGLGFPHPSLDLELDHPLWETLRVFADPSRKELLLELRVRIDRQAIPHHALLRIEWLLLQNPRAHFSKVRPPLPGQKHPGLGLLNEIIALLVLACDRLQLDGVLFVPAHYHTAAPGRRSLRFLDPKDEGLFRALESALQEVPLAEAAHAVAEGKVVDAVTGQALEWQPATMVLPVSERMQGEVESPEYEERARAEAARHRFHLEPGA